MCVAFCALRVTCHAMSSRFEQLWLRQASGPFREAFAEIAGLTIRQRIALAAPRVVGCIGGIRMSCAFASPHTTAAIWRDKVTGRPVMLVEPRHAAPDVVDLEDLVMTYRKRQAWVMLCSAPLAIHYSEGRRLLDPDMELAKFVMGEYVLAEAGEAVVTLARGIRWCRLRYDGETYIFNFDRARDVRITDSSRQRALEILNSCGTTLVSLSPVSSNVARAMQVVFKMLSLRVHGIVPDIMLKWPAELA